MYIINVLQSLICLSMYNFDIIEELIDIILQNNWKIGHTPGILTYAIIRKKIIYPKIYVLWKEYVWVKVYWL